MTPSHSIDEELVRRLPLPLAQLYRRAHNAKTPLERHLTAFYLWEASLKLLASVAIVEYAQRGIHEADLAQRLENLARPSLGHWWELTRRLVSVLADAGDDGFRRTRDVLLGRTRDDLPWAAGLDAALRETLEGVSGARATVRLSELFERLVTMRNRELGHGAAGQRESAYYARLGPALLAGVADVLARLDMLAGRRLVHVGDVRRLGSGAWLIERYELLGETARRLESLELAETSSNQLPRPGRLYLLDEGAKAADCWRAISPLIVYEPEPARVLFLNSQRRRGQAELLCYTTGEVVGRQDLAAELRVLLVRLLGTPVNECDLELWAARSQAEEPPAEAEAARAQRSVGEFELISRLGRGGMGVVYRAWQPSLGRQVALKCLLRSGDPKAEARFAREIRVLGSVEHPHLVKAFTSGSQGDQWFYAMELVEGADLGAVCAQLGGQSASELSAEDWTTAVSSACQEQRRKEEPIDSIDSQASGEVPGREGVAGVRLIGENQATRGQVGASHIAQVVEILRQASEAAHALHESGVVHRDIKPGNIMLSAEKSHAVLMDLGLAQLGDAVDGRLTRTRQFVGTLRYASPEQVLAADKLDRRADVYSLGATLWELLTLRPLFGATEQMPTPDLMLKIQTTDPDRPRKVNPRIPADLEAIVLKCLEKDRARRYATAADLAADLSRWLRGDPVQAQPPSLGYLLRKKSRRYRVPLTAAALVLIVGIVAAVWIRHSMLDHQKLTRAQGLVETLVNADTRQVPGIVKQLDEYAKWAKPLVVEKLAQAEDGSSEKLRLSLALLSTDPRQVDYLYPEMLRAEADDFPVIRSFLAQHKRQIIDRLWTVLQGHESDPEQQRLRAAGALAAYDPGNPKWKEVAPQVAGQLIVVNPVFLGQWQEALLPVADKLLAPLAKIFNDPTQGELPRTLATSLLADYAKNDPEALTSLVINADAKAFAILFPVLQAHGNVAIAKLQAVLARTAEPTWNDPPLDPAWADPPAAVRAAVEAAHGMLAERFAFCLDLPWEEFPRVAEDLRLSGYRPTRVRPYAGGGQEKGITSGDRVKAPADTSSIVPHPSPLAPVLVAAVWTRDGARWELQGDLGTDQLPAPGAPAAKDGLLPADFAPLPAYASAEQRFVLLWSEPAAAGEQRPLLVDLSEQELDAAQAGLVQEGFTAQSAIGVWTDATGQRHYAGIWSNQGAQSELRPAYAGFELVDQPQWDVTVTTAARLADPLDGFRLQLAQIMQLPAEQLDQPQVRFDRAVAQYHMCQLEPALADLDFLIEKQAISAPVLQFRTWTLARLGKVEEARAELAKFLEQPTDPSTQAYVRIVLAALIGERDEVAKQLEAAVADAVKDPDALYLVACAAALASQACGNTEGEQSQKLADLALELLEGAVALGFEDAEQLRADTDVATLHGDPRFTGLLDKLEPTAPYAAVWRADVAFESRLMPGLSPEALLTQSRDLAAQGYRPVAIAAMSVEQAVEGNHENTPPASSLQPLASSVWHRPLVPDIAKEDLAQRQATAAVALLRMAAVLSSPTTRHPPLTTRTSPATHAASSGLQSLVFSLLEHRPDPRLRSYLLHRLAPYGVDPVLILAQMRDEKEVSRRRALTLAVGELAHAKLLTDEQKSAATINLARWYADDPDPGIHGAAEWALKQMGADAQIARVRQAYATGNVVGGRQWYLTKTGLASPTSGLESTVSSLSLVVLRPEEEFLMGSPVTETERYEGPTAKFEMRHRRRIGRTFAIGAHEVSVEQFKKFRVNHDFERSTARERDAPANSVSWYDAAAFCNWLSEREGIPREQWCYDPGQKFEVGMQLYPDYLSRTGYRLPTEAEWECACRAGAFTARFYGETDALLGEYAWYTKNSGDRWTLPAGSLKPNECGLFDVQGNVLEWCHDAALHYERDRAWVPDKEQSGGLDKLDNSVSRVLRGGSFSDNAPDLRSADRSAFQPDGGSGRIGFRVARTME